MVSIIEYEERYKEAVIDFVRSVLEDEFDSPVNQKRSYDLYDIPKFYPPRGNFWLALDDRIVGTVAFLDMDNGRGYLKRMYVAKDLRGTGLAQQLLTTVLDHARSNGFKEIYLGTVPEMERAVRFYEKQGFERTELPEGFPKFGDTLFYRLEIE